MHSPDFYRTWAAEAANVLNSDRISPLTRMLVHNWLNRVAGRHELGEQTPLVPSADVGDCERQRETIGGVPFRRKLTGLIFMAVLLGCVVFGVVSTVKAHHAKNLVQTLGKNFSA